MQKERNRVCPVALANRLTGRFRRWLHDPQKVLSPFVKEGMTVLDIGCGPGFFSIPLAELAGRTGTVVAADLQDGMLQKLRDRIQGTEFEERIRLVKCDSDRINVSEQVDFGLAFWMIHEVPGKEPFFRQLKAVLKEGARVLIAEPKLFHVSRAGFEATLSLAERAGFESHPGPRLLFSWSAVLVNGGNRGQ